VPARHEGWRRHEPDVKGGPTCLIQPLGCIETSAACATKWWCAERAAHALDIDETAKPTVIEHLTAADDGEPQAEAIARDYLQQQS